MLSNLHSNQLADVALILKGSACNRPNAIEVGMAPSTLLLEAHFHFCKDTNAVRNVVAQSSEASRTPEN